MEGKAKMICIIAGILGLISAVLGFVAEATKVKASEITADIGNNLCVYPSSPASVLGFISALSLLVALIVVNSAGGCFCCYRTRRCECGAALVCFIFSWLAFVPGFLLMLGAASLSRSGNMNRLRDSGSSSYYCYYVKQGVFSAAACLSFLSVALSIGFYRSLDSISRKNAQPGGAHIAMGQPQVPPTMYQPNYV